MYQIQVSLVNRPSQNPIAVIGGLAKLTQYKKAFEPTSHETGLKILKAITSMGHTSLLESADFGVIIQGASRVFLAQITRHRMCSFTSQSQQYQDHDDFPYLVPDGLSKIELEDYHMLMFKINDIYKFLKSTIGRDQARYVLPGSARNDLYMKTNAREWIGTIFPQRLCKRNTLETLYIMKMTLKLFCDEGYKELFQLTGPACVTKGKCDQGSMACGKPYTNWEDML
jgi:thymidylate synthase (FAD)